jgi:putative transposase
MNINRSSYYKWLKVKDNVQQYELNREFYMERIKEVHHAHSSYGYHAIASIIRNETGLVFSDNIIHKCCKFLGIKSKTKHYKVNYEKSGDEHKTYPNMIYNHWNAKRPMEIVVTDMTCIRHRNKLYDLVLYMDTFNNEIISYSYTDEHNSAVPYYEGLEGLLSIIKGISYPTVLHSDQGSTYSSVVFNNTYKDYNIIRSMSRAGTPTDNPKMESINGWIKAEIDCDWDINSYNTFGSFIDKYIYYYNNKRPACALNYKTPVQYRIEQGFY